MPKTTCYVCKKEKQIEFQNKNTLESVCTDCIISYKQKKNMTRMVTTGRIYGNVINGKVLDVEDDKQ